jgi:hypothetical protein
MPQFSALLQGASGVGKGDVMKSSELAERLGAFREMLGTMAEGGPGSGPE